MQINNQVKFDEVDFQKQMNAFGQAMETDLNKREQESSKRWGFNFAQGQPTQIDSDQKMSWEPVSAVQPQTRPRLQISRPTMNKPKMSLGNLSGFKGNDNPFAMGFSLGNRDSFAMSDNRTESTAAESMFSTSVVSVGKNVSIVDIGLRTSFANSTHQRRQTEKFKPQHLGNSVVQIEEVRSSNVAEESSLNKINVEPITKSRGMARIDEEEKQEPEDM